VEINLKLTEENKQVLINSKPQKLKSVESEIEMLKLLKHRNIVRYLGITRQTTTLNIFLELISGEIFILHQKAALSHLCSLDTSHFRKL
jgi:serine/threonine protein kinase